MSQLDRVGSLCCANCGTALEGEFCHHCGQSVHSVLKPMHHMLEDGMDMVLHVDGRIVHTLPPLLLRPGFLTLEYFAGRRVRYIAPFRLMFVLCLLAFAMVHVAVDGPSARGAASGGTTGDVAGIDRARTPEQVRQAMASELASLEQARRQAAGNPAALTALGLVEERIRDAAAAREAALGGPAHAASTASSPVPITSSRPSTSVPEPDLHAHPVTVGWLPAFANHRLDMALAHMRSNLHAILRGGITGSEARERAVTRLFASLPQVLLVMVPLFALLLKVVYLFRRRLYMEHLIVALHSHAFLFLALLLAAGLAMLDHWLGAMTAWVAHVLHLLTWVLACWVPVYLLLMQKRVYRQGWGMTLLTYGVVGGAYLCLLCVTLLAGVVVSLAR